ncbi:MAG: hypothetical protein EXR69_07350 [Myxococcales bacterium]|nr:hypothetical protein [Myxococcales bacterium]
MPAPWYLAVLAGVGLERLAELSVAKRNAAWSLARGGVERGQGHYPFMVVLHTGLLLGCLAEAHWRAGWVAGTPPVWAGVGLLLACQCLRWWVIRTLGPQWNTRVIIVPGLPRVTGGPFRWFSHPNYVAVVTEGVVLPGMYGCWVTAATFTVLNTMLLTVRVRAENAALAEMERG